MSDTPPDLSPQERLNLSRRALVRHMAQGRQQDRNGRHADTDHPFEDFVGDGPGGDESPDGHGAGSMWQTISRAVSSWWRSHPAHLLVDVGEPVLERYASKHPFKLLGVAAGLGALAVAARPWRLISLTGVAVAALKSTQVSSLVASMLSRSDKSGSGERPRKSGRMNKQP